MNSISQYPFYSLKQFLCLFLFAGICLTYSCDDDTESSETTTINLGGISQGVSFIIYTHDSDGQAIRGAHLTVDGKEYCSTEDGLVIITNANVSVFGSDIEVTAEGYLPQSDILYSVNNGKNVKEILLYKASELTTSISGITALSSKVSVSYPDTLLTPDNEKYFEEVNVISTIRDRNNEDVLFNNLVTISTGEVFGVLESFVDIKFDTYSDDGEVLSLRNDTTMMVSIELANVTLDSITYYSKDDLTGYWKHEGYFNKDPLGQYTAKINATSVNIAIGESHESARLIFQAKDTNTEKTLPNIEYQVYIKGSEYALKGGKTDNNGYGNAIVPYETELTIILMGMNHEFDAGPIISISDTVRSEVMSDVITVDGQVTDCDGEPSSGTIVKHTQSGETNYSFVDDGSFNLVLYNKDELTMEAIDLSNVKKSTVETIPSPTDGMSTGVLSLCDDFIANEIVNVSGNITENTTWRNCNQYILNGVVAVKSGVTLTIEKGTLIKANGPIGFQSAGLVIERGGEIDAVGTADKPIIFTSVLDDIKVGGNVGTSLTSNQSGQWLGIIILGKTSIIDVVSEKTLEGLPSAVDASYLGGGADDDSGTMSFVSIRHAGGTVLDGSTYGSLTLAGVGSSTSIRDIEIYGSATNGLHIIDGSNSPNDILCIDVNNNGIQVDQPWVGTVSNSIISLADGAVAAVSLLGNQMGVDTTGIIRNISAKGFNTATEEYAIFTNGPQMRLENSYLFNFSAEADIILSDSESSDLYQADKLILEGIEIDTSHLTNPIVIGDILLDASGNVFENKIPNVTLVGSKTVGANKTTFLNWTAADAVGKLDEF